jgi:hypothetical protein
MEDRGLNGKLEDIEMDFKQIGSKNMAQIELDKNRFQRRLFKLTYIEASGSVTI